MLAVFVASFATILFILWQMILGGGGAPSSSALARPTPIPIPPDAVLFGSLAEFNRATKGPSGAPFVLVITEEELNERIAATLQSQPDLPFRDVEARVGDDVVVFTGLVRAVGLELSTTVGMRPLANRGQLGYELTSVNLGPLPVPGVARTAITDSIDREIQRARPTEGFTLDAIQARDAAVTLVGRFR